MAKRTPAPAKSPTAAPVKATPTIPGKKAPGFKVRAIKMGYYNHERKRVGDVFMLTYAFQFSSKWMVRVDAATPEKITTGQQVLRKEHDETLKAMASATPVGFERPANAENDLGSDPLNEE
jgi:hypothetical protein